MLPYIIKNILNTIGLLSSLISDNAYMISPAFHYSQNPTYAVLNADGSQMHGFHPFAIHQQVPDAAVLTHPSGYTVLFWSFSFFGRIIIDIIIA